MLLKTSIAPVLTKLPHYVADEFEGHQRIVPLQHPNHESNLCWLDEMLGCTPEGKGLWIPHSGDGRSGDSRDGRPFLVILSGPPGSAKSTLALQICFNFARTARDRNPSSPADRPAALYITTETSCQQILDKARGFGWEQEFFRNLGGPEQLADPEFAGAKPESTCYIHAVPGPFTVMGVDKSLPIPNKMPTMDALEMCQARVHPEILVIDSFNTLPDFENLDTNDRRSSDHPINRLMHFCYNSDAMRPRVLFLVLDVEDGDDRLTKRFRYFADATFRIDMLTDPEGMLHRTIEITKIKLQKHAAGKHAIDIIPKPPERVADRDKSPFLDYGGLFVYPSIEWYLDFVRGFKSGRDASISASHRDRFEVLPDGMGMVIAPGAPKFQGFFAGHTTSLIGRYDILKKRFAYASMLANVIGRGNEGKAGLIVSLDHDKEVVTDILAGILVTEFHEELKTFEESLTNVARGALQPNVEGYKNRLAVARVNDLFHCDKLGFIHNEPAYITPGEFFHRVYVAFKRPRESSKTPDQATEVKFVVIDGLDRIDTKFPLCAKEPLFVSALLTLFKIEKKACSIFLSSQDGGSDGSSESALTVLSELVLRFDMPNDLFAMRGSINRLPDQIQSGEKAHLCAEVHAMRVPFGLNTEPKGVLWTTVDGRLRFNVLAPADPDNLAQGGFNE